MEWNGMNEMEWNEMICTLYRDPLNRKLFPEGSVGFQRNLGSMIAPTRPRRQPQPTQGDGGCRPYPNMP